MKMTNTAIDIIALEEKERDYEQKWRCLIQNVPDIIMTIDQYGIIMAINRTVKGLTKEQVIGTSIYGYILERYHSVVKAKTDYVFRTGKKNSYTIVGTGNNGTTASWYSTRIIPQIDDGGVSSAILISTDITAQKKAENKLRSSLERAEKVVEGTIQAIAKAVEMRDPYTAGHQRRVAKLACIIAKRMRLPAGKIKGVRVAGILHDIGKIYVPAEILTKPERLNEIEFSLVKEHPRVGYEILKNGTFPWPIADIIKQHHERLDGSGYPMGIGKKDIMLEARILAVADIVEAMASHRPYRPALGIDKALKEIKDNRGRLYDAAAVDVCVKILTHQKTIEPQHRT